MVSAVGVGASVGVGVGSGVAVGSGSEQDAMNIATSRMDRVAASRFSTPHYSVFNAQGNKASVNCNQPPCVLT